ncbi:hypothetical protein Tco_0741193 [Tanacetum coccineum]
MIQHEFITFTILLKLRSNPQNSVRTFRPCLQRVNIASLEYSHETEDLIPPNFHSDDIRRLLELERVMVDCTIKSQTVTLTPNQILTKELRPDIKQWEEIIRENVFGLGGHRDHLPACLAHMLYCVVAEEQCNLAYFFVKRIECARANPKIQPPIFHICMFLDSSLSTHQARHSVLSSSSHHHGTSSHQHDDDDDDVKTSRASTLSTGYIPILHSLNPLNYQTTEMSLLPEQKPT